MGPEELRDKPTWQCCLRLVLLERDCRLPWHGLCIMCISRVLVLTGPMPCKCLQSKTSALVLLFVLFGALYTEGPSQMLLIDWQPVLAGISQGEGKASESAQQQPRITVKCNFPHKYYRTFSCSKTGKNPRDTFYGNEP